MKLLSRMVERLVVMGQIFSGIPPAKLNDQFGFSESKNKNSKSDCLTSKRANMCCHKSRSDAFGLANFVIKGVLFAILS